MLSRPVHVLVICTAGPLEYLPTCRRVGRIVIGFFRPIKIKNKYYIVYNNSI